LASDPGSALEVVAATWLAWDGRPHVAEDGERIYTPHKAISRHGDHLIDHLAEVEALLGGIRTEEDHWYGSIITLASNWAPFTEAELNEACQRLSRHARFTQLASVRYPLTNGTALVTRTGPSARSSNMSRLLGMPSKSETSWRPSHCNGIPHGVRTLSRTRPGCAWTGFRTR
jgi:hypothetical protein